MNLITAQSIGDAVTRVALSVLMQTSVVIVPAALLTRFALRYRADARHGLWLGALVWVLICPAMAALADRSGRSLWSVTITLPGQATTAVVHKPSPDVVAEPATEPDRGNVLVAIEATDDARTRGAPKVEDRKPVAANSRPPNLTRRGSLLVTGAALLWLIGVVIGLARILLGCHRLAAYLRDTRPLDPGLHGETLAQVREALGVVMLPPIVSSSRAREPLAIGLFSPRVVLPEGLTEKISNDALLHILVHECAHILRRDPLVGLLQRLAGTLYWPHPLVHYLNSQLSRAREEVCDNHVLQSGDRFKYARTLLTLTQICRPAGVARPGLGLLTARWTLADRVAGLLDPRRVPMTRAPVRMKIVLAVALAATGLTAACLRVERPAQADETGAKQTASPAAVQKAPADDAWRIEGSVVDKQGRPVAGAVVHSVPNSGTPDEARTAADGTFALALQQQRPFVRGLVVETAGGVSIGLARFEDIRDPRSRDPVKIVLKPSRTVLVRVRDAAGVPVPGAAVEALDFSFQTHGVTGPGGVATLRIAADAQVQWVIGLKPGVGFDYFENYRTRPATDFPSLPEEVALTLDGAQTIRIKAIDSKGQPVPDVAFSPWIFQKPGKTDRVNLFRSVITMATTDRAGEAAFAWFPKEVGGTSFRTRGGPYTHPNMPRYEREGPTELTCRLIHDARLTGIVRLPDGRPASQVLVRAQGSPPRLVSGLAAARTGKDGRYSLEVPSGASYIIAVDDENWAAPSLQGIVVHEGQPRDGLDFTLSKGTELDGQVTEGPDHHAAAGAMVTLVEMGGPLPKDLRADGRREAQAVRRSYTDSQGRYHFRIGPGQYQLKAPPLSGNDSVPVAVKSEAEIVRDLALKGSAAETYLSGVVVEKTKAGERPIANAIVYKCGVASSGSPSMTDAAGRFRVLRTPGEHVLYAHGENGLAGFSPLPETADEVKVLISQATTVSGRVVDSSGKPLPGHFLRVTLAGDEQLFLKSMYFGFGIRTDEQGRFAVKGAPVGSEGELSVAHHVTGPGPTTPRTVVSFNVPDLEPVKVPDLVIPDGPPSK